MRKNIIYQVLFALTILLTACISESKTEWELLSPDKNIKFKVYSIDSTKQIAYDVQVKIEDKFVKVIDTSPLGITRNDESFISPLSFISKSSIIIIDEKYTMITGKQSKIHNYANELSLSFSNENEARIDIILRAYDDGIAFKYFFPEESEIKTVINESTGFKIPLSGKAWIAPYDTVSWWAPAYETYYENEISVGTTYCNFPWC